MITIIIIDMITDVSEFLVPITDCTLQLVT